MFLTGKLRSNGLFSWLNGQTRVDRFAISAPEFKAAFRREKALAGRNLRSFTLVVFRSEDPKSSMMTELLPILEERVRLYDTVGFLVSGRLAALLPETGECGAAAVADAILSQAAGAGLQFSYQTRSYPSVTSDSDRGSDEEEPRPPSDGGGPGDGRTLERSTSRRFHRRRPVLGDDRGPLERASAVVADLGLLDDTGVSAFQRGLDLLVCGSLLVLLMPLFAVVGILIKLTSPGPVIFKQQRAGQGGQPFWFYKFRSMRVDAEKVRADLSSRNEKDGPIFKIKNDPRMTPIGRFLRKTSIDELPQLWNVVRGDMTLVGPRPPLLEEVEKYESWQRERLSVKGGLTCLWQVSGRSEIGFEEWVRMDLRYAQRRSAALDLLLLLRTAKAVVSGRGAY